MNRIAFAFAFAFVVVAGASACSSTTVTVLTQAPPGRRASLDVDSHTLTVSQGLAIVLECTQYDDNAGYSGPCRDMSVTSGDDALASILPAHLDALAGQQVGDYDTFGGTNVSGPPERTGVLVAAHAAGTTTLDVTTTGTDAVSLTLVVEAPPTPPAEQ